MIFLNKSTGVKWEISNEEHIRRLLNDKNYEVIEEVIKIIKVNIKESTKLKTGKKESK